MDENYARIENPALFGKVAVLMGGSSAERDISLQSGHAVLAALQSRGVDADAVDPSDKEMLGKLKAHGYDRVFNILHGRGGEDGVVQGFLEMLELPYTGSGVLGSALCIDKLKSKQVWIGAGLPTPGFVLLETEKNLPAAVEQLGFPIMVKPVHEGSSIGMNKVDDETQLEQAWREAKDFDAHVLAEQWVEGPEFTAGIVDRQVLPLIRLETPRTFYDYEAKYEANTTRYHCSCGLSTEHEKQLQTLSLEAFDVLGASGWGRVDFMLDCEDRPWLIEVNTVPGMTDHSLVPMAAKEAGMEMPDLVWRILETSERVN